jgi:hypothetical protein
MGPVVEDAEFCFIFMSPLYEGPTSRRVSVCLSASVAQRRMTLALLDIEIRPDMRYPVLRFPITSPAA